MDCGPWFLLCSVCDNTIHSRRPCHDREAWLGDRFHPISPTQSVDSQGAIVKQGLFFLFGFSYISEHRYFKFIAFFSIFLTSEVCCSAWAWVLFTLPQTWRVWHSSLSQHQNHCYSERYLCCAMETCISLALCVIVHRLLRAEWCPLVLSCMWMPTRLFMSPWCNWPRFLARKSPAQIKISIWSPIATILQFVAIALSRPFRDRISEEPYNVFCQQRPCKLRCLCRHLSYSILLSKTSRLIYSLAHFILVTLWVTQTSLHCYTYRPVWSTQQHSVRPLMSGDISTLKYNATRGLMGSCALAARTSSTLCMLMGTRSYTVMRKFPGTGTVLSVCYYLQYINIKWYCLLW